MLQIASSLGRLVGELKKLPGVGEKTALRLALHLLKTPDNLTALAESLQTVHNRIRLCSTCFMITEDDPCPICSEERYDGILCVVEEPQDVLAIERSAAFRGRYHVLHGALSPLAGVTPGDLRIAELTERLEREAVREVVIATNFSIEGEATALYLTRLIKDRGVRVTRLAHGIPTGGDLEFVDAATMSHALERRSEM